MIARLGAVVLCMCGAAPVIAQSTSVWLDANAAHNRPPAGTAVDAASYGLLGIRLRADGRRSTQELGISAGRGANAGSGSWLSGRASLDASKVTGALDYGLRAEATGLTYLTPVQLSGGTEYEQLLGAGSLRPYAGVSIVGFRVGLEGVFTGGVWGSQIGTPVVPGGPRLPLSETGEATQQNVTDDGTITVAGGAATMLRVFGPATLELRATSYHARNQVTEGQFTGVDGTLALALGAFDVSAGARSWNTPVEGSELGGHVALGVGLGNAAYLQTVLSRSVTDPISGAAGDVGFTAGISVRLGSGRSGPPLPATVGAASGRGRVVRFTLHRPTAQRVAVAGDFSNWEPRSTQRDADGNWILETVLEPGTYHYSFVIDGETWFVPQNAPGIVDDGFGQKNATLVVSAS